MRAVEQPYIRTEISYNRLLTMSSYVMPKPIRHVTHDVRVDHNDTFGL